MGLFFQGKRPKKGEIFRDPEPIAFFSFAHSNEGECEWRNQHRPSKGTWIRPVQSRTSSMILTNDYQRTINLGRGGPMTTPTQSKGQRSSLGLPVTSTPFSDLKALIGSVQPIHRKWPCLGKWPCPSIVLNSSISIPPLFCDRGWCGCFQLFPFMVESHSTTIFTRITSHTLSESLFCR